MARRPPQSAILRRSESRKKNRQKRRQRNRRVPAAEVRPVLAPGGPWLDKCWFCHSSCQEMDEADPPIRYFRDRFCNCKGSVGLICETCIELIVRSQNFCPKCRLPWKKEDLRIEREPITQDEFRERVLSYATPLSVAFSVLPIYFLIMHLLWPPSLRLAYTVDRSLHRRFSSEVVVLVILGMLQLLVGMIYALLAFFVFILTDWMVYYAMEWAIPFLYRHLHRYFPSESGAVISVQILEPKKSWFSFLTFNFFNNWMNNQSFKSIPKKY